MDNLKCSICLSDIKQDKDIKTTCEHVFHKKCLRRWTLDYNKHSCPICRDIIKVPKNKHRCHLCFHTYCKRNYRSPGLSLFIGSVVCNSLGYCCWCNNPDFRKPSLEQYQEEESTLGDFDLNDEEETETMVENNPNLPSIRPYSFMEIYNITIEEMESLRSENIQLWGSKFPSFTRAHLKQLNDQTVITARRLLTETRFSHLSNQQITNILLDIYPADRPIFRNQARRLCQLYQIKSEDIKYIHFLVNRWLPYYQIKS